MILRLFFAAAAGVVWGLQFGRDSLWLAPWLALAPFLLLLGGPKPGWIGFVHGLATWATGLYWIVPTLETFGQMSTLVAVLSTGLLVAYLASFHAAFAALGARVWRRGGRWQWLRLAVLPALWVGLEWLRAVLFKGFPWNLAAYAWVDVPGALPLASWIGAYGVSLLVLFVGCAVAAAIETRKVAPVLVGALLPLLLLPVAARWSLRRAAAEQASPEQVIAARPVRLIQPNVPNQVGFDDAAAAAAMDGYQRLVAMSRDACEPDVLVVWPESAAWPFVFGRDPLLDADLADLTGRGCTVLFNSVFPVDGSYFNSAFLLAPGRPVERYDKRHLVPFGEYVPFSGVISWVDKLARNAGDYRPAQSLRLLPWGDERLGMSICYEVIFPEEVAATVRRGATLLVTITNDAWYGDTSAPWQHLRAARFRAAENRRTLVRAAITGVSAWINPDGSVARQIGVFEQGTLSARVSGLSGLTPYARAPWLVPTLASALALVGVSWGLRRSRR